MNQSEWIINKYDNGKSATLSEECEIPLAISNVLVGRGMDDPIVAKKFFLKSPSEIRDPRKLPDCEKAVQRLKQVLDNKEKIFVWGDYDVDGITATSVIVTAMRLFGAELTYRVPNRIQHGYDIKRHSVDECIKEGATLMMSVDCGIVAFDTAIYAKEKNIDLIITDHHAPDMEGEVPDALAIVNPSRLDSEYGFTGLCGATVAFKLMMALAKEIGYDVNEIVRETLEFVALGTVADVAPMIDENRVLVDRGCKMLSNSSKVGIQEILKIAGATEVDPTTIGFQIGPRMNAIGRLEDPMIAVELMLEQSPQRAKYLAMQLDTANKRRQAKQEFMFQEAIALVESCNLTEDPVIVCWAKAWHPGLIGLVAGKLAEKYQRPAIVMAVDENGIAKGSCRSTRVINILNILRHDKNIPYYAKNKDKPILGGHAFAAGFSLMSSQLENFRKTCCEVIKELNPDSTFDKKVFFVYSRIVPGAINDETFDALQQMAPFGSGNAEPVFMIKNVKVEEQKKMSNGKHLKLILSDKSFKFKKQSALLWHKGEDYQEDYTNKNVDMLFTFAKESKGYGSKFYLTIVDFRESI